MKESVNTKNITLLLPLLMFVIFTACILFVLLAGTDVYRKLSGRDQDNFEQRTVVQYLTTRIRQNDTSTAIFAGNFEDGMLQTEGDTLFLKEELKDRTFYTRIYCHEGYLRELFSAEDVTFLPDAGQEILELHEINFCLEDNLLYINMEYKDSSKESLVLYLRSGMEVAYEK